ncbi:MAG: cytochrome c3 family protein [Photobacterium frigidiphilum]|uniref:cytochrome c3 family protein n=1 Tax=Photobacterium frigidiphilum TaxID=264736 RepID=UPI0030033390
MKNILVIFVSLLSLAFSWSVTAEETPNWDELAQEYTLKPHHKELKFDCVMCHSESDPADYEVLETENCLSCHGSAQKVADRLKFMDANHTNPHNSFHDRLDLDCYECHAEHEPSANLCAKCHKVDNWMSKVP